MKVVAFTGAGISQESGLGTFRKGGMWEEYDVREVANVESWYKGDDVRKRMLDFYNVRRRDCRKANPNDGHLALADLEKAGHQVRVITQNIDDLHERAGSTEVIHLHGEIFKVHPEHDDEAILPWPEDLRLGDTHLGSQLRPHVVWFGEDLPAFSHALDAATEPDVDVLLVVGTTLEVGPANQCAFRTRAERVFVIDPDPPDFASVRPDVQTTIVPKPASIGVREVVHQLLGEGG